MNKQNFEEILRIQKRAASLLIKESEEDKKIDLMTIINNLTMGTNKRIPVESVILEAKMQGIEEEETLKGLNNLAKDKIITSEDGFIQQT